jgi:O-antigen/teichoic acid export membrane protein
MDDLKKRTARGAISSLAGQSANVVLRLGSMMILARLLSPRDFGLVAMSTALTGFIGILQDAGLVSAAIQARELSAKQSGTLFWLNLAVGAFLGSCCAMVAPALAHFYHEPQVAWIVTVMASAFVFNGAAAQHRALLTRAMRLSELAILDAFSTFCSVALGISLATIGYGYWALVVMLLTPSVIVLVGVWILARWLPGRPGRGVWHMIRYGGILMADAVLMYIAWNVDKVLIGRFLGAPILGIYGRAYTLIGLPNLTLSNAVNNVTFSALSRLQHEPERFRRCFLKSYTLFVSVILPILVSCALFGDDIIRVFLGPKWEDAIPTFRALAPGMLALAFINPTGILLNALGRVGQGFWIGCIITPAVIAGYWFGLPHGPVGVATGFSIAIGLVSVPSILLGLIGTPISALDVWRALAVPLGAMLVGVSVAAFSLEYVRHFNIPLVRLLVVNTALFVPYVAMLFFGQREFYHDLLRV